MGTHSRASSLAMGYMGSPTSSSSFKGPGLGGPGWGGNLSSGFLGGNKMSLSPLEDEEGTKLQIIGDGFVNIIDAIPTDTASLST